MSIRTKPLDEITWQDIETLAASGAAEDAMLEFKGLLPEKNGKQHPWYDGRDDITTPTRDKLAEEVVALANAYGGRLVIGIAETQDRPRKAAGTAPLPRCGKFAEQFEQALRSLIDPPIGGLQLKAIVDPSTEDAGAVVIAVPASDIAPHGIGRPPSAYVRRGTSCDPMTMRDLQSVFWDARTRRERVDAIRSQHNVSLRDMYQSQRSGELRERNGERVDRYLKGLCVRISAIPQHAFLIEELPASQWSSQLRPSYKSLGPKVHGTFGEGYFYAGLTRTAHGLWAVGLGPSHWSIRADGTVSVMGFRPGHTGSDGDNLNFHFPGWYAATAAQIMIMADRIRRYAGRPDIPIEVDCEIIHDGSAQGGRSNLLDWTRDLGICLPLNSIGPFLLTSRASIPDAFNRMEREIWHAFGVSEIEPLNPSFATALQQ